MTSCHIRKTPVGWSPRSALAQSEVTPPPPDCLCVGSPQGGAGERVHTAFAETCNGTPLQYSCLENPMDGGAWWAAVHGVAKSQTRLSDLTSLTSYFIIGEGNGNPFQYSCLENPTDRGAWRAMVHGVAKGWTRLK